MDLVTTHPAPPTAGGRGGASAPAGVRVTPAPAWGHRWALELRRTDGEVLGQVPVPLDIEPARAWLGLESLRRSGRDDAAAIDAVTPIWHASQGAPYLSGFRAAAGPLAHEFPLTYFGEQALAAGETLVAEGRLARGDRLHYVPLAFPSGALSPEERGRFVVEEVPVPTGILPGSYGAFLQRGAEVPAGDRAAHPSRGGLPVFLAAAVLDDALALARRAGEEEAGGILLGHLRFDPAEPELFLETTALVEAPHTRAAADRLTFTAETWAAVRGTLALRGRGERMVGWFHSHPAHAWCRECPPESQRRCRFGRGFFSLDDRWLHRTVFPAAWSVALLVTRTGLGEDIHTLFGWHRGSIERRGYHVLSRGGRIPGGPAARAGEGSDA